MRPIPIAALTLCLALPVHAQGFALPGGTQVRPDDTEKLAQFDTHYGQSLREAFATGSPADIGQLTQALSGPAMAPDAAMNALQGDWKCRTMKLGDGSGLIVYGNFACRVEGADLEKTTGSQRTRGTLHPDGERLVYLGTGFVQGSEVPAYAELPEDPLNSASAGQIWSDIGVVEVISDNHARIIFPDPALESQLNVLELTR